MANTTATPWHIVLTALGRLVGLTFAVDYAAALLAEHGEPGTIDDALAVLLDLAATAVNPDLDRVCRQLLEEHAPTCPGCAVQMTPITLTGGWYCATGGCPNAWPLCGDIRPLAPAPGGEHFGPVPEEDVARAAAYIAERRARNRLYFDELTEFTENQYTYMLSRLRSGRGGPSTATTPNAQWA